ncbi:prealbumin-like fold domain-containing protein, partial [Microbacterium album]|uniref:SpaA-like prealbumin fold domain-containing protein n=1 Tax=Microbacterium album TaxID=2053191 RepID=A0A916QL03_9MICO
MNGSEWAVYDAASGGTAVVASIAAATDADGDPLTGLFRDTTLTEGEYWLEETRALPGFQLLAQRVPFTVARDGTVTLPAGVSVNVTLVDVDGTPTIRVQDVPALDLPEAGGIGTLTIYLAGAALLAAAGVIAGIGFARRRASAQRDPGEAL